MQTADWRSVLLTAVLSAPLSPPPSIATAIATACYSHCLRLLPSATTVCCQRRPVLLFPISLFFHRFLALCLFFLLPTLVLYCGLLVLCMPTLSSASHLVFLALDKSRYFKENSWLLSTASEGRVAVVTSVSERKWQMSGILDHK